MLCNGLTSACPSNIPREIDCRDNTCGELRDHLVREFGDVGGETSICGSHFVRFLNIKNNGLPKPAARKISGVAKRSNIHIYCTFQPLTTNFSAAYRWMVTWDGLGPVSTGTRQATAFSQTWPMAESGQWIDPDGNGNPH